jgi:hypothetical protein
MNSEDLTEADIRTKFITPALQAAGWDIETQLLEEIRFTDGRYGTCHRGKPFHEETFSESHQLTPVPSPALSRTIRRSSSGWNP